MAELPVPDWLLGSGPSLGRDRARRGVPLNDLLTAVRPDFRVLWAGLRERADPADEQMLVARMEDVWRAVDDYPTQIRVSYQVEAALLARERQGECSIPVASLLAGENPTPIESSVIRRGGRRATSTVCSPCPGSRRQARYRTMFWRTEVGLQLNSGLY